MRKKTFGALLILIAYLLVENISRNINLFRPFYYPRTNIPLFKPRFVIRNGQLTLRPNPITQLSDHQELLDHPQKTLSRIGPDDFYYQNRYKSGPLDFSPLVRLTKMTLDNLRAHSEYGILQHGGYNTNSEAFAVTTKLFDEFYRVVLSRSVKPIILLFPRIEDHEAYKTTGSKPYRPLLSELDAKGYDYIDLMDAFDTSNIDINVCFVRCGHHTPYGNKFVADHIRKYLNEQKTISNML